jgi:hypothetical protein
MVVWQQGCDSFDYKGNIIPGAEIYLYKPEPTVATMSSIKSTPSNSKVTLQWKTEMEMGSGLAI